MKIHRLAGLRSLLVTLVFILLLGSLPTASYAQEVVVLTDADLVKKAQAAYTSLDFFNAAMYFQAYIQRNPLPMRTNAVHASEVKEALNYSIRAVRAALLCRTQSTSNCGVDSQGLLVSKGFGLTGPLVKVEQPPKVNPLPADTPSSSSSSGNNNSASAATSAPLAVVLFDGSPNTSRRKVNANFCSGFDTECDFGNCPVNYKLVFGPYCRESDYPYIEPGLYRVTISGSGPVTAGATDYGTSFQLYGFGKYTMNLPGSYTFCWPGRQQGGYGFETIVQAGSTSSVVSGIRIEYLGKC